MSLLQAYLCSPKTQRVLSRRPGDKGFSLIELVVVVAVLAILAAVAIPQFTSINDKAAVAAAQNSLAQIVKECAVKKANMETEEFLAPNLSLYTVTSPTPDATTGMASCAGTSNLIALTATNTSTTPAGGGTPTTTYTNTLIPSAININVLTGAKGCTPGTTDTDYKFCTSAGRW